MKYLFYKATINNRISSDDFCLSGYRKITYVMLKKQMCPLSSGYHCVIKRVRFAAHTSDLYWQVNSNYLLFVILRMEAYILNVWVLLELKQKSILCTRIYSPDLWHWFRPLSLSSTRMYSMMHFQLYNYLACSCTGLGLIFINFFPSYNRNGNVNSIWNSSSYCISELK